MSLAGPLPRYDVLEAAGIKPMTLAEWLDDWESAGFGDEYFSGSG